MSFHLPAAVRIPVHIAVAALLIACVPSLSHAAEIHATNSTQYLWYQNILTNESQGDVADYLRVNVTKLDKAGNLTISGYGRVTQEVTTGEELKGRLYYLFLNYRDAIKDHLDFRLGRSYVNAEAFSGTVDGLNLNVKNIGPLGFTLFGGRNVILANKAETGNGGDAVVGTSVYLDTVKNTHAELSYGRKYADSDLARENVGLDISTAPVQMLGLYGRARYDTIGERLNELLFGAKVSPVKDLTVRGEFYQSRPTFDKESIYNIFQISVFNEASIAAEYQLNANYSINAKYAHEDFDLGATANLYKAGVKARPIKDLTLNASYERRIGYAGALSGVRFNGEYRIWKAILLAGIDFDDFTRQDSRDGNSKKYWAGLNLAVNKMLSASVRIEDNDNFNYSHNYQGFTTLNLNF
jgi:hypothetical protein